MDMNPIVCVPKNAQEEIRISLEEFKGHKFIDMRVYLKANDGKDPIPTKKGLAISPSLWPGFRAALVQVDRALIEEKLLDAEDLDLEVGG
jgi:hypothetical protein